MLSGTRERVSIHAKAEMPNRASPSHTQPFPIAFSTSDVPCSFALAALRVMPCLSKTCPDADRATANSRTARLLRLIRALLSGASSRSSASRTEVTLRFRPAAREYSHGLHSALWRRCRQRRPDLLHEHVCFWACAPFLDLSFGELTTKAYALTPQIMRIPLRATPPQCTQRGTLRYAS